MYTYQDLLEAIGDGDNDKKKMEFVRSAIANDATSDEFKTAVDAREYYEHRNTTIIKYQKLLYTVTGKAVPDKIGPNFKMTSNFFRRFQTQENQYLLSNGVTWGDNNISDKLGTKKYRFDTQLQKAGISALVEGVSFGFWNLDHLEVFRRTEFVPLWDEDTGMLRAGIRYWQIDETKPLRATLYEEDGYTDYKWSTRSLDSSGEIIGKKTTYVLNIGTSEIDGTEIMSGENYPSFPIIPLWADESHQSPFVGLREQIDCYDLIKSGFANNVDEASIIYWTLQNAGGMDDIDLAKFIEKIRTVHAAALDDAVTAESHSQDAPYESREALLTRLRADLYEDAMALDTKSLASGGSVVTAVIKAAYEPLDEKCNGYEYQVLEFIDALLDLTGLEGDATFTRSKIVNAQEDVAVVIQAAQFLDPEYITRKIMTLLGDSDQVDEVLDKMAEDEMNRFNAEQDDEELKKNEPLEDVLKGVLTDI